MAKRKVDPEIAAFEAEIRQSVREMRAGEAAVTHTPDDIIAMRRKPGRPVAASKMESVTMRMGPATMTALRGLGPGWQTKLREFVARAVESDLGAIARGGGGGAPGTAVTLGSGGGVPGGDTGVARGSAGARRSGAAKA